MFVPRRDSAHRAAIWALADAPTYAYLLGCYLGDGHLLYKPPHSWTLRISCDPAYPVIEQEIASAMSVNFPDTRPRSYRPASGRVDVLSVSHPAVGRAFPQHGPGRKHLRQIGLADWQYAVTREHPGQLIRGLIHSDGCRVINRFRTKLPSGRIAEYSYVRYFFSNLSADIRSIFVEHCELLGIRVTRSNPRNLTVSHRDSVAILEALVGPKR
jgi:hypothetical protein